MDAGEYAYDGELLPVECGETLSPTNLSSVFNKREGKNTY